MMGLIEKDVTMPRSRIYMESRSLRPLIAGEISPSRFNPDKLLKTQKNLEPKQFFEQKKGTKY